MRADPRLQAALHSHGATVLAYVRTVAGEAAAERVAIEVFEVVARHLGEGAEPSGDELASIVRREARFAAARHVETPAATGLRARLSGGSACQSIPTVLAARASAELSKSPTRIACASISPAAPTARSSAAVSGRAELMLERGVREPVPRQPLATQLRRRCARCRSEPRRCGARPGAAPDPGAGARAGAATRPGAPLVALARRSPRRNRHPPGARCRSPSPSRRAPERRGAGARGGARAGAGARTRESRRRGA